MQILTIGRESSNNIVLPDSMVSRHHAHLIIGFDGQVTIKDIGSSNGTYVNGNRVTESNLKTGDVVKCGTVFLDWQNFKTFPNNISQPAREAVINNVDEENLNEIEDFSLLKTLQYLFTKIFDIGYLFKTEWKKTGQILFFGLIPVVMTFFLSLYFYSKMEYSFPKQVILPTFAILLVFGIPQFITLSLFSINAKSSFSKNLLAGAITGSLEFLVFLILIFSAINLPFINNLSGFLGRYDYFDNGYRNYSNIRIFLSFFGVFLLIGLWITHLLFTYFFFKGVGIKRGYAIHFTNFYHFINILLKVVLIYIFIRIAATGSDYFPF